MMRETDKKNDRLGADNFHIFSFYMIPASEGVSERLILRACTKFKQNESMMCVYMILLEQEHVQRSIVFLCIKNWFLTTLLFWINEDQGLFASTVYFDSRFRIISPPLKSLQRIKCTSLQAWMFWTIFHTVLYRGIFCTIDFRTIFQRVPSKPRKSLPAWANLFEYHCHKLSFETSSVEVEHIFWQKTELKKNFKNIFLFKF